MANFRNFPGKEFAEFSEFPLKKKHYVGTPNDGNNRKCIYMAWGHAEKIRKMQLYFLVAEGRILRNSKAPTARRRTLAALRYGYAMERAVGALSIELLNGSRGAFSADGWQF